jgi:Vitamin-D-receptor interacting Mediator subunit 4
MGSLTTPSDPPTMAEQVLAPLTSIEISFNSLLTTLTTTPTYSAAPATTHQLLTADTELTSALQTLHTHQKNYTRILNLRAEAERLEEQIRSTIRTCVDLRKEIGDIHPSILSYSGSEDSDDEALDGGAKEVDYKTLLSFAAKLGKFNAAAAKEVEEESTRRVIEARKRELRNAPKVNGKAPATAEAGTGEGASQDLIPHGEKEWLDAESAMARARSGMAFPPAERLRLGMLGRLQWVREQQGGEEAVEREVARLLAESEGRGIQGIQEDQKDVVKAEERPDEGRLQTSAPSRSQQQAAPRAPPERKKSEALDLDLWNESDEDED